MAASIIPVCYADYLESIVLGLLAERERQGIADAIPILWADPGKEPAIFYPGNVRSVIRARRHNQKPIQSNR